MLTLKVFLVTETNEKQNPDVSYTNVHIYTNKYQNHVGSNFDYKFTKLSHI